MEASGTIQEKIFPIHLFSASCLLPALCCAWFQVPETLAQCFWRVVTEGRPLELCAQDSYPLVIPSSRYCCEGTSQMKLRVYHLTLQ